MVDALNAEWQQLLAGERPEPRHWSGRQHGLSGDGGLAGVMARASEGCDVTLSALLGEAQAGDRLAARTVLQSQLGRLVRLAARDRRSAVDDYVALAWCVILRYPLGSRPERIAANLALDTLKAVHAERADRGRGGATCWPVGEEVDLLERGLGARLLDPGTPAALDAGRVIEAGYAMRLLDESARTLLQRVYLYGLSGVEVARRCDSTPGSVRVRCSRAVRLLAAHAAELAEAA